MYSWWRWVANFTGTRPAPSLRRQRTVPRIVAVAVAAASLTLSACGGATQPSSTGVDTSSSGTQKSTTTTSVNSSGTGTGTGTSESGSSSHDELAWVPFGPNDPDFPTPGWDVYFYFLKHDCQDLQGSVQKPDSGFSPLYDAAVAACRAAVDGEQSQWDVAATAYQARNNGPAIGPAPCVDDTIATMVAELLAWHDKHPGQRPALTFPQTADGRTACSRDNNSVAGPGGTTTTSTTTTTTTSTTTSTSSTTSATTTPSTTPSASR